MNLVMFDIDGTLTDTFDIDARHYFDALSEVLGLHGVDITHNWEQCLHVTDTGIASELCQRFLKRDIAQKELQAAENQFVNRLQCVLMEKRMCIRELPGASVLLQKLSQQEDMAVAIATGGWKRPAKLKLRYAGIPYETIPMATSSDASSREEIMCISLERAKEHYGVSQFRSLVYVGDGIYDVNASRNLGWGFIGVAKEERAEKLRNGGAASVIPDYKDTRLFGKFLDELQSRVTKNRGS